MTHLYWREDDPEFDGIEVIVPCPQCGKPAKDWGTLIFCGAHLSAKAEIDIRVLEQGSGDASGEEG